MLPGQVVEDARLLEAFGLDLGLHLRLRHLVQRQDRHVRILGAVLEQRQTATWLQRLAHPLEHSLRLRELVVDVHHDDQIERRRGQLGIVDRSQHRTHVRQLRFGGVLLQQLQHPGLDVDGVDLPLRADEPREPQAHVARARPHVADARPLRDLQQPQAQVRVLFALTLPAVEPRGPFDAHRRRVLPAGDRMYTGLRPAGDAGTGGHDDGDGK